MQGSSDIVRVVAFAHDLQPFLQVHKGFVIMSQETVNKPHTRQIGGNVLGELGLSGELQGAFVGGESLVILALLVGCIALLIALQDILETLRLPQGSRQEEKQDDTRQAKGHSSLLSPRDHASVKNSEMLLLGQHRRRGT